MDTVTAAFLFLFGSAIGSFLNVCIYRIPRNISVIFPFHSLCPDCGGKICAVDNIPLLSFFILKGRCRSCNEKISLRYPLVEAITGGMTLWVFWWTGLNEPGLAAIIFVYVLTAIFFIDLEFRIIPDTIIIAGLLSGITLRLLESIQNWKDMLFGAFLCSGFLLLVSFAGRKLFHKESMGGGDIKLGFMIGIFLGFQNSSVDLFSAYMFAAVFEGGRSLLKGKMPKGEIFSHSAHT